MVKRAKSAAISYKRRVKRTAPASPVTKNPPLAQDLTHQILPGFAAYATTRFTARVVATAVANRWPKAAKHAGPAAALASAAAAYFGAHRVERLVPYHDAIVVGSAIAAAQTIVRTYVAKYGWMIADYQPELEATARVVPPKVASAKTTLLPGQSVTQAYDDDGEDDEGDDFDDLLDDDDDLGSLSGSTVSYADME